MRKILPTIMAFLTKEDRYFPDIEWSRNSWTHNVFRAYEMIFGRRYGIRAEASITWVVENGETVTYHACHSWESVFALAETYIREFLRSWKPLPFRIFIPQFATPNGVHFASPYLFAIAFDAQLNTAVNGSVSSVTRAFTTTGSDRFLHTWAFSAEAADIVSVTYNGDALTKAGELAFEGLDVECHYIINPDSGANNIVWTATGSTTFLTSAGSYTGVNQSFTPVTGTNTGSGTTLTGSLTTVDDNSWVVWCHRSNGSNPASSGTNWVLRAFGTDTGLNIGDTGAAITPAGLTSFSVTAGTTDTWGFFKFSISPAVAAGPANLKSLDGNLKANIKSFDGNVLANIKSIDGNA